MGLQTGFDPQNANFEDMAIYSRGNMYIEEVQHKTYIKVNEIGTIAGAVTEVEMAADGALQPDRRVVLDRPFVYVIFDFETYLPLFIGIMQNPQ
jgi:serpin B